MAGSPISRSRSGKSPSDHGRMSTWSTLASVIVFFGRLFFRRPSQCGDLVRKRHLAVVFGVVPEPLSSVGDAPEAVGVPADPIHDQERDPVFIGDVLRLDHADRLLHLITSGEVRAQSAVHTPDVSGLHAVNIILTRTTNPPLHHLQLPPIDLAGGEDEPKEL